MIVIDLMEWIINLFIFSVSLVAITMVLFVVCLVVYSIQDWRGK